MGREFSGVLGFLAFTTVTVRSFIVGGGFDESIKLALIMMFTFAVVGYFAGSIAQQIVRDSAMSILDDELESMKSEPKVDSPSAETTG
jgi:hypothetical protein